MEKAPRKSLSFSVIRRWPGVRARRWAVAEMNSLALRSETDAIVAIGSAIRPVHHSRSDVDFLVIANAEIEIDLTRPLEVDLINILTSDVDRKLANSDEILGWAVRLGQPIFERRNYWSDLCAKWKDKIPLPASDQANAQARRFLHFARELWSMGDVDAALQQIIGMLTHQARARLANANTYPDSRPELPAQLRGIGEAALAKALETALLRRRIDQHIVKLLKDESEIAADSQAY